MRKNLLLMMSLFLTSFYAQASWHCDLQCKVSAFNELDRLPKHSSGPDYEDFSATCKSVHQGQVSSPESGCEYVYCWRFEKSVQIISGHGASLTEARQDARKTCVSDRSSCGMGAYRFVGEYSCSEY